MAWVLVLGLLAAPPAPAQISEFLPEFSYSDRVPTPESVIGYPIGEWHVRHDQLVRYAEVLAATSDRVAIEVTGRTHEERPLILLTITAEGNHARLDELKERHRRYVSGESEQPGPLVLWFGYSIHGDEASGSNAALLMAYHLAAAQGEAMETLLEDTVILIDPSLNPDGLGRFAQWANGHRGRNLVADRNNREHQQAWPGGRFNHYWFDLNRDWLLLVHPESRARVGVLQKWRPHVLTDFHEMGSDQTYFFQPGVPERRNPLTPERNAALTAELARFHARALDAIGQPYFSEERFDDFYYGKGSTYPDAQGMIGILFEQASARGHLMATRRGDLAFPTAIGNHLQTSLSTLAGGSALRAELNAYRRWFVEDTAALAARDPVAAYILDEPRDPARSRALAERLLAHGIELFHLAEAVDRDGRRFEPGSALLVPTRQPQYRLLKSLFEERTSFQDATFYDISAWNFAAAFDLPMTTVARLGKLRGEPYQLAAEQPAAELSPAVAYAIEWDHYFAPKVLARLLAAEVAVRVAAARFTAVTASGNREFDLGTLIIPGEGADKAVAEAVAAAVGDSGVPVIPLSSGLTPEGPDLGSSKLIPLQPVRPLLVTGRGVSATQAGEVWHLLDTRVDLPLVMIDGERLPEVDLDDYTHVLMVDGDYADLDSAWVERLRAWIQAGGILVATQKAAAWATSQTLYRVPDEPDPNAPQKADEDGEKEAADAPAARAYGDYQDDHARSVIGGAIVRASVDPSHPLAYGLRRDSLALFRQGTVFLKPSDNPYETPLRYRDEPLISGFLGPERGAQLAGSAALIATKFERGAVIRIADNPNFRGFWYGTNRLYFNALFFAQILEATPLADTQSRL